MSLSQKQKQIQSLRNFPTYPRPSKFETCDINKLLAQAFPKSCSKLTQRRLAISSNDEIFENWCPNYENILIGIKYGICPVFGPENLKFFYEVFQKIKSKSGKMYLQLHDDKDIFALVRVKSISLRSSFKFWNVVDGTYYPVGLIFIQVIAIGQVERDQIIKSRSIETSYGIIRNSVIKTNLFGCSDDFQWNNRKKFIHSLENQIVNDHLLRQITESNKKVLKNITQPQQSEQSVLLAQN